MRKVTIYYIILPKGTHVFSYRLDLLASIAIQLNIAPPLPYNTKGASA